MTPDTQSPSHSIASSPILQDKLNSTNGSVIVPAYHENVGGTTYFYQFPTTTESNISKILVNV